MEADGNATAADLWDAAYEAYEKGLGSFVEPDHEQVWNAPVRKRQRGLLAGGPAGADRGIVNEQSPKFPRGPGFAWHLGDGFTQLEAARNALTRNNPVRAAIFDVGFDLKHNSFPEHVLSGRNFADGDPTDVTDKNSDGVLDNPGHGTATIALLAGKKLQNMIAANQNDHILGGAPNAIVLPIRIAKSVLLLRTSAFAEALQYVIDQGGVDVVSMSMGGLASEAWADVVNLAYERGILVVTAAGNNYGRPKSVVFPARFNRVVAACGIMADLEPYVLPTGAMSGNYGPDSKMDTAIAAFTPNIPWAEINSANIVDLDGEGTSSATPQVAAAALLWLTQHKHAFDAKWQGWERVEMVRKALFQSADPTRPDSRKYFGRGILKARAALKIMPTRQGLRKQPVDSASFGLFRVLRGTIFPVDDAQSPLERMFEVELAQLIHRDGDVEATLIDPIAGPSVEELKAFVDAVIASPWTSARLRSELERRSGKSGKRPQSAVGGKQSYSAPTPALRSLRVFAFDPMAGGNLETVDVNETMIEVPWEDTKPGPCGEYVEVIDHDPASGCFYMPVELHDPRLLATDGLALAEGNPRFHQQMVYAVAMRTISTFEKALGRKALWSPRMVGLDDSGYVGQLRIYPHALLAKNAYYNPLKKALLLGYFPAEPIQPGTIYPGGIIFTCLSHDVIAHETAHALLDGMNRGLIDWPTNPDILAFHEAFADIVALFQHFTLSGILHKQLARVRGDLRAQNLLGELAQEFGRGTKLYGALRSYIGNYNEETKQWEPLKADPRAYEKATEQHDRGAVLVSAVFAAFLAIYERRIADLKRIASEGTGILKEGDLHPDLVARFAHEAQEAALHVLKMCVRAIDYCPPLDMTFGDYLRAMITADYDVFPVDELNYRVAMIEAFRERGIYPRDVRAMSTDTLRWQAADDTLRDDSLRPAFSRLRAVGETIRRLSCAEGPIDWPIEDRRYYPNPLAGSSIRISNRAARPSKQKYTPREAIFHLLRRERAFLNKVLKKIISKLNDSMRSEVARLLGLNFDSSNDFEVRSLNFADRIGPGGITRRDVLVQIRQRRGNHEGGCTIIADCDSAEIRYAVSKNINAEERHRSIARFRALGTGMTYFGNSPLNGPGFRFGMLHSVEKSEDSYA
jgi:hypothetical protein